MSRDDAAQLYDCRVMHCRHVAPRTRFVYGLFYLLIDVDRIDAFAASLRLFSHNRFNLFSLHDRDHGSGERDGLRCWAERLLRAEGIEPDGGRIRLLCLPRVLGLGFNPLSLWYCEDRGGALRAVIAEVRNTFGERHSYLLRPDRALLEKDKIFHVSPFLDVAGHYRFRVPAPEAALRVTIRESQGEVPVLDATLCGRRVALSDGALLSRLLRAPWTGLKVMAAIHWQALKIWIRGARLRRKPLPPPCEVS